MRNYIAGQLGESASLLYEIKQDDDLLSAIEDAANACISSLQNGGKILLIGNGGSAADAQHIAAELVGRFAIDRAALPAIALTTDTSALTAIGNDYGFESIFYRQVQALGKEGDVLIAYSTSGHSENILSAIRTARQIGITRIAMTGGNGIGCPCEHTISVPSESTAHIQEAHAVIGHILCGLIERAMFHEESPVP